MSNAADFTEFDTLIDQMDAAVAESSEYRKSTRDKLKLIHNNIVAINTWVEKYSTGITNSQKQSDDLSALVAQLTQDLETATQKGTEDMKTIEQMAADKTKLEADKAQVDAEIAARVERMTLVQEKMKVWLGAIRQQPEDFSPDQLTAIFETIDKIVEASNIPPPPPSSGPSSPSSPPSPPHNFPPAPSIPPSKNGVILQDNLSAQPGEPSPQLRAPAFDNFPNHERLPESSYTSGPATDENNGTNFEDISVVLDDPEKRGGRRSRRRRKQPKSTLRRKTAARGRKPRSRTRSRTRSKSRARSRSRPRTKKRTHRKRTGAKSKRRGGK